MTAKPVAVKAMRREAPVAHLEQTTSEGMRAFDRKYEPLGDIL